jgi:site-specific DNA recombinase
MDTSMFAYIRVSTLKQGAHGVSLQEQRDAIDRHARHQGLRIARWFEERETAAKRGRPVFSEMLRLLRRGDAAGAIFHKIDRSARNLRDWVEFCDLVDEGRIQAHFAVEGVDLGTRGGRLSADLQAVIAADYIRNLREETKKGFYGRLKQGIYPLAAPIGYLDQGGGKPKVPDPERAPLIREAFALYASGRFTLRTLAAELAHLGLRTRRGATVYRTSLDQLLRNPFYIGLIRLRSGQTFAGIHEPLISKALFDRVQATLAGKVSARTVEHDFMFRKLLRCKHCRYTLIGERQKGHVYYRCHTVGCSTTTIREETVESELRNAFTRLQFSPKERAYFARRITRERKRWAAARDAELARLQLDRGRLEERLRRLTDGFADGVIDREVYIERQAALLHERVALEERTAGLRTDGTGVAARLAHFLELAGSVAATYESASATDRRDLIGIVTSNREVQGRSLELTLALPFRLLSTRKDVQTGAPIRDRPRTLDRLLHSLTEWFATNPTSVLDSLSALCPQDTAVDLGNKAGDLAA